jgi:hypothetical protein
MDLTQELQREHSRRQMLRIASYIGDDPERFKRLMEIFLGGPYRLTQRAAWAVNFCASACPQLILPYVGQLIPFCQAPVHDAVKRNVMRILQSVEVTPEYHGELADLCFHLISQPQEAVAIKASAMTVAANLCRHYPELANELKVLIEEQLPYQSAAFRSRGQKVLKKLRTLPLSGKFPE